MTDTIRINFHGGLTRSIKRKSIVFNINIFNINNFSCFKAHCGIKSIKEFFNLVHKNFKRYSRRQSKNPAKTNWRDSN